MKKSFTLIVLTSLFFLLGSCATLKDYQSFPYGSCQFRGWDNFEDLVFQGTLYINRSDSTALTGNWNIWLTRDVSQLGMGYLTGYIKNNEMYINLTPDIVNLDFELFGTVSNDEFKGNWSQRSSRNIVGYGGTFILNKNQVN